MRAFRSVVVVVLLTGGLVASDMSAVRAGPGPEWVREPGGTLRAVTVGTEGAVYVTGSIWTAHHFAHAWVVSKLGPHGGLYWRRTWRRPIRDWQETGTAVAPAPGGGVYVGGSAGRGECGTPQLMRLSGSGDVLWRRALPNPECYGWVTGLDANTEGVVASVTSQGCCAIFDHDGYVQAMTPDGRLRWRRDFEAPGIADHWDGARGVTLGGDGRVYVAGEVDLGDWSGDGPLPDEDIVVQRLSRSGGVDWTRVVSDPGVRDHDLAWDVDVRRGAIVVAGGVDRRRWSAARAWLSAFDTQGQRLWSRRWGQGELQRVATAVSIAPWGPIYVGAERDGRDPTLQRWTIDGELLRERQVGPSGSGSLIDIAADGAVYLTSGRHVERWSR